MGRIFLFFETQNSAYSKEKFEQACESKMDSQLGSLGAVARKLAVQDLRPGQEHVT